MFFRKQLKLRQFKRVVKNRNKAVSIKEHISNLLSLFVPGELNTRYIYLSVPLYYENIQHLMQDYYDYEQQVLKSEYIKAKARTPKTVLLSEWLLDTERRRVLLGPAIEHIVSTFDDLKQAINDSIVDDDPAAEYYDLKFSHVFEDIVTLLEALYNSKNGI